MKLLNNIRYIVWIFLESLKKDSVYSRKKEIERCMNDDRYYQNYINNRLKELISHAINNTEFYKKYKNYSLEELPIVNKNIIMDSFEEFKAKNFTKQVTHEMSTSGSTGRPFKIVQDLGKRKQVLAEIIYFSELVGYKVGKKIVYLRNLERYNNKSKLKQLIQNEELIYTQKYDEKTLESIVKKLKTMGNNLTILSYASTLQAIASYMEREKINLYNIDGIISGAETITNKIRKIVKKQFNCPVVSRYSNQEMGILAQDYEVDKFTLNRASYYFEVLNLENDEPVKIGEMGRIVVTDLYNYAMPMIRYDTGDLGVLQEKDNKYYFSKVYGRKLDLLYSTSNEPISFFALDDYFEPNLDIEQYQIIQEDRTNITLNIIMKEGKKLNEKWCIDGIKKVIGKECEVKIKYLNTIPITESGKFKYVICKYKPEKL